MGNLVAGVQVMDSDSESERESSQDPSESERESLESESEELREEDEIGRAAREGDAGALRAWLEAGGDANKHGFVTRQSMTSMPLLMLVARSCRDRALHDCVQLLLEHGANVHYVHMWSEYSIETVLRYPVQNNEYAVVQLLVSKGADSSRILESALLDESILRILLLAGRDLKLSQPNWNLPIGFKGKTPMDYARACASRWDRLAPRYETTLSILEGVRLAGSYKEYVLQDYKYLLRVRSLLARGRAKMALQTPEAIARLFGGTGWAPRCLMTRQDRPRPAYFAGVPDPIFWKVMEYWRLGDWRRPYQSPLPFHDGPPRYRGPSGTLFRGD